jgi:drug/metabolite transporter (DMT)-like permease
MIAAVLLWIATEIAGSLAFRKTPIPQIVWMRYFFHLVLMGIVFGGPSKFSFVRTSRPWLQLFRSLLMLTMPLSYGLALQTARMQSVYGVFWVAPFLVIVLSAIAGERVPRFAWVAGGIGWLGALIVYTPPVLLMSWAVIPSLVMALSFSLYIVLTRVLDRTEPLLTNLFYSALGVFLALSIALPWFWTPIGVREVVGGAAVAVCGWLGLCVLELAIRRELPSRLAPFLFTQVIVDVAARALDREVVPAPHVFLGVVFITAAGAVTFMLVRRAPQPAAHAVT